MPLAYQQLIKANIRNTAVSTQIGSKLKIIDLNNVFSRGSAEVVLYLDLYTTLREVKKQAQKQGRSTSIDFPRVLNVLRRESEQYSDDLKLELKQVVEVCSSSVTDEAKTSSIFRYMIRCEIEEHFFKNQEYNSVVSNLLEDRVVNDLPQKQADIELSPQTERAGTDILVVNCIVGCSSLATRYKKDGVNFQTRMEVLYYALLRIIRFASFRLFYDGEKPWNLMFDQNGILTSLDQIFMSSSAVAYAKSKLGVRHITEDSPFTPFRFQSYSFVDASSHADTLLRTKGISCSEEQLLLDFGGVLSTINE